MRAGLVALLLLLLLAYNLQLVLVGVAVGVVWQVGSLVVVLVEVLGGHHADRFWCWRRAEDVTKFVVDVVVVVGHCWLLAIAGVVLLVLMLLLMMMMLMLVMLDRPVGANRCRLDAHLVGQVDVVVLWRRRRRLHHLSVHLRLSAGAAARLLLILADHNLRLVLILRDVLVVLLVLVLMLLLLLVIRVLILDLLLAVDCRRQHHDRLLAFHHVASLFVSQLLVNVSSCWMQLVLIISAN